MIEGALIGAVLVVLIGAPIWVVRMRRARDRARLAERRQQNAERMAQLGAMTGGLAHEIKNPLSTIGLNAQLIAEAIAELPVDHAVRGRLTRRIDALRREVDRLRDILEDFLTLAGSLHLDTRPVDLNELAQELVDFYAPQASSQGVTLRLEPTSAPALAEADPAHLKQAILNLMLNALQVMAANSSSSESPPRREIILRTQRRHDHGEPTAALHVIDTGPGIAADQIKRIFHPYFSTRSGGAGLGLAITRRIVSEHDGWIDVHSEIGKGSDFTIVLPAAKPACEKPD